MRPLFITFEGLDGCGKTTHLKRVFEWLSDQGIAAVTTHEPGGTPVGEEIRRVFKDRRAVIDGVTELLLVFASRRLHLAEVIEPALAGGRHVLCDRFTDSSYAYQGSARGLGFRAIDQVDEIATGRRRPDLTLLFDLDPVTARGRGSRRGDADRLDAEAIAFYERVRSGFLKRAAAEPERIRVIDSSGTADQTFERVRAELEPLVLERD